MLIVKIMSGSDMADDDPQKAFTLFTGVKKAEFIRDDDDPSQAVVELSYGGNDDEVVEVYGNVYVMNEAGKTISTFTC